MARTGKKYKLLLRNQLDWLDPDQELYHQGGYGEYEIEKTTLRESLSIGIRSVLALIICIVIPAYLYFGLPEASLTGISQGIASGELAGPRFSIVMPEPPPGVLSSDRNRNAVDMGIVDYAAELNQLGYLDELSGPAVQAFYQKGVTIDYLNRLDEVGLLGDLSFPAIVAYYENGVPVEYLSRLDEERLLDELSFPAVVSFNKNEVPIDYLEGLDDSGYLDEFSFPALTAFFQREIPIEFLDELKEKGLLEKLSFPDIIGMYESR